MAVLPSINLPAGSSNPPTIDTFVELIGRNEPLHVIDVATQSPVPDKWTVGKWSKYFSAPRNARKRILNVISLEFSHTPLKRLIRAPQFVLREDWVHTLWPPEETAKWVAVNRAQAPQKPRGRPPNPNNPNATIREISVTTDKYGNERLSYPKASYYFLAGVAGCYTDFHIDFGGSSVWYNILEGRKEFFVIPPTEENLELFEKWSQSEDQDATFFGDLVQTPIMRIVVEAGQTLLLPSGWIHAVYTPLDSMVLGGNFLHKYNVDMQIKITELEQRTNVPFNSRFPFWWLLQFYYLKHCAGNILHNRDLIVQNGHLNLMPDWERRGLIALQSWASQNTFLCPEGVLDYPINFYLEVISFRLRGMYPMSFPEWREFIKAPKRLCVCQFPSEITLVYNEKTKTVTEEVNPNVMSTAEQEASGSSVTWIGCDWCGEWYHGNCVGVPADHNLPRYFCPNCIPFGPRDLTPAFLDSSPVFVPRAAPPPPPPRVTATPPAYAPKPQPAQRPTMGPKPSERPTMSPKPVERPTMAPKPVERPTMGPKPVERPKMHPRPPGAPAPTSAPAHAHAPPPSANPNAPRPAERPTMRPGPNANQPQSHPSAPQVPVAHPPAQKQLPQQPIQQQQTFPHPYPQAQTQAQAHPQPTHSQGHPQLTHSQGHPQLNQSQGHPQLNQSQGHPQSQGQPQLQQSQETSAPKKIVFKIDRPAYQGPPFTTAHSDSVLSTSGADTFTAPTSPPSSGLAEEAAKPKAFKFTLKRPREEDIKPPVTAPMDLGQGAPPPHHHEESFEPSLKAPRIDEVEHHNDNAHDNHDNVHDNAHDNGAGDDMDQDGHAGEDMHQDGHGEHDHAQDDFGFGGDDGGEDGGEDQMDHY